MTASPAVASRASESADVVLCATQRLARRLRVDAGAPSGTPARMTRTIAQWLDEASDEALLAGRLADERAASALVLTPLQERRLWQRVIEGALRDDAAAALFSLDGLARAAQEAHALATLWRLPLERVERDALSEETRQFVAWRRDFLRRCRSGGWIDSATRAAWQVDCVERGLAGPAAMAQRKDPLRVAFAGFDRLNPLEQRLRAALVGQGAEVIDLPLAGVEGARLGQCPFADREAELRSLAGWVAEHHRRDPAARIGIVVPDLGAQGAAVCRALDAALVPDAPDDSGLPPRARPYNVSLGEPLVRQPLVATALALLRLAQSPRQIEQTTLGALLTGLGWSRDLREGDARARFEARCRARLPALVSLERVRRFAEHEAAKGRPLDGLRTAFAALAQWPGQGRVRRSPSRWAAAFGGLLEAVGWPGERPLSSDEYQTREAFFEQLEALAGCDELLGEVTAGDALSALVEACGEQIFQAETEGNPTIQVLGLLEAATERFDALWVCGLTDAAWPPPPRPNPLLPAQWQRAAGTPNASPEVQSAFAAGIHRRFQHAASEVVFSWPQREGERELAASPLLAEIPALPAGEVSPGRIAHLQSAAAPLDALLDATAPAVGAEEKVAGGTWLLRAQAICPAWAYYQYRLGANRLETPIEGLDARARGSLVHCVLEAFWQGRSLAEVKARSAAEQESAIAAAVDAGLAQHTTDALASGAATLPARFAVLERSRLIKLLRAWVEVELQRPAEFRVVACEEAHALDIDGIAVDIVVDRLDETDDGRRIVIDYKTGRSVDAKSWAAERISEPQLPIYATYTVAPAPLAGIAFARVVLDDPGFVGVSEAGGLLPKVKGLDEQRKLYPAERFADWAALGAHWQRALRAIAAEVRAGVASVTFTDEQALDYCDVRPLLRLAERRRLFEAGVQAAPLPQQPGLPATAATTSSPVRGQLSLFD